ncbi:hypothetical protein [Amycolatopsis dongchuanensis]|uniref:Uncharacterized protein n=1 Tax=Amycolatopsis dongchuanensis TaxID=1070866 RepID=A0ABP8VF62_9PSEU
MSGLDQLSDGDGVRRCGAAVARHLHAAGLQLHRARDLLSREVSRVSPEIDEQVVATLQTLDAAIQDTQRAMLTFLSRAEQPVPGHARARVGTDIGTIS